MDILVWIAPFQYEQHHSGMDCTIPVWTAPFRYGLHHSHFTSSRPLLSMKQTFLALQFPPIKWTFWYGQHHSSMNSTILILHLAGRYCHWNKPFWRCSSLSFSLALKYFDLFFGSPSLSDPESTVSRCWVAFLDILWFEVIPNLLARVGDFSANALKLLCMRAWSLKKKQNLYQFWGKMQSPLLGNYKATISWQWCTQKFCLGGGFNNSVEDRENGDLGAVAP